MGWLPEQEPLQQLVQCLKDSLTGQNPSVQKNAEIVCFSRHYENREPRADSLCRC